MVGKHSVRNNQDVLLLLIIAFQWTDSKKLCCRKDMGKERTVAWKWSGVTCSWISGGPQKCGKSHTRI